MLPLRQELLLLQFFDPGLKPGFRNTAAEALSLQPVAASGKGFNAGAASPDSAAP